MFSLITRKPLWVNIILGIGLVVLIWFLFALSLNWITHHGEAKTVPAVTGKTVEEVRNLLDEHNFELVIQDSIYNDTLKPGIVVKQVPEADAVVKVNRTVYVTVNRTVPPDVEMPNLIGYSFRNAEMVLSNMGLKLGDTTFKPDFAKNSVLEQIYNGNDITPGTKVKMGSPISLVIGGGIGNTDMAVPKLIGLTYGEAKILLDAQGLILGSVIPDPAVRDTAAAFVYRQTPEPKTAQGLQFRIRPGQMMDIWLSVEKPVVDSTKIPQPPPQPEP
ncbi:PASTA domain-containing protein [Chitinophagaceae bacterium LB-8]|uniref:PASTA domain-containing protein n=1 Tax=Paraflavisolibacter caeni TaxID=2982496 RepID=A0A9X2XP59_9BACT|nr:PASTA domain-containing protein [Paraflavisolibacter caeni]MCU7550004.1 PASTA domain-containing protein [Paraflavisolibacter caeni]